MNIKLGLYEIIDNRFEEWLGYDVALQLYFVTNDVEIYGKNKYSRTIYRAGLVSTNKLNLLLKSFNTIDRNKKEELKKTYFLFIDAVCKPDKKVVDIIVGEEETERNEAYTERDEFKFINDIDEADEIGSFDTELFEEQNSKLETLVDNAKLSNIELYALNYVKDRNSHKHPMLEQFTLKGIIQIANRAAYKLFYLNESRVS